MGARVLSLAVGTTPAQGSRNQKFWAYYYRMTADLEADERFHTGLSRYSLLVDRGRLQRALELLRSDYATQMAGLAELSPLPGGIFTWGNIDLVHCNHYFNMPLALRLKEQFAAPILLETHDVQSRQYELRGATSLFSKRKFSLSEMEESELALVARADILAHINADEHAYFSGRLPGHKHALLYPALHCKVDHKPTFLAVASANYPNYLSIAWLLEQVLPHTDPVQLAIVGNVDGEFQERAPRLYERHRQAFKGRVKNLQSYYDRAVAVLLPTVAGHGLAIKTVEALESGAPLIATSLAFRGMAIDLGKIANLRLADTPVLFARHISEVNAEAMMDAQLGLPTGALPSACDDGEDRKTEREWLALHQARARRLTASSRKVFHELFSFPKYVEKLEGIAGNLVAAARPVELACYEACEDVGIIGGSRRGAALH
jgi:glycosyltransferase involved in cell wall biosynthesis